MIRTRVVAVVIGTALAASCSHGPSYGEGDLRSEAELTYPGATETRRSFSPAESGRSIHLDDLSSPAQLDRHFDLDVPTPSVEIYEWYEAELTRLGWTSALGLEGAEHTDGISFQHTDGSRTDSYSIRAGFLSGTVTELSTRYSIDVERDGG